MFKKDYQFPSVNVSKKFIGEKELGERYHGEGQKLLYQLKNYMSIRELGQMKMTRVLRDGTVITAGSHFGNDSITINTKLTQQKGYPHCSITFIDLPEAIPPMANPGEILQADIVNVDYIKTYYTVSVRDCDRCKKVQLTVCTTDELGDPPPEQPCTPFIFTIPGGTPAKESDPTDHCILPGSICQAEIITLGKDAKGKYMLWKAYTEWPPDDLRGLGYMLWGGFIALGKKNLCTAANIVIKVDCCEKYTIPYRTVHTELLDLDIQYTSLVMQFGESQDFEALNGCYPFTWEIISGGGSIGVDEEDSAKAIFTAPESNPGCEPSIIRVTDRCDKTKDLTIAVTANVSGVAYEVFSWNSLYQWGGIFIGCYGTIYDTCISPIISAADAGSGTIIINRYGCTGGLIGYMQNQNGIRLESPRGESLGIPVKNDIERIINCYETCGSGGNGACNTIPYNFECEDFFVNGWGPGCEGILGISEFDANGSQTPERSFVNYGPGDPYVTRKIGYNGQALDVRTQEMKDSGCCPINPETGLPF